MAVPPYRLDSSVPERNPAVPWWLLRKALPLQQRYQKRGARRQWRDWQARMLHARHHGVRDSRDSSQEPLGNAVPYCYLKYDHLGCATCEGSFVRREVFLPRIKANAYETTMTAHAIPAAHLRSPVHHAPAQCGLPAARQRAPQRGFPLDAPAGPRRAQAAPQ